MDREEEEEDIVGEGEGEERDIEGLEEDFF